MIYYMYKFYYTYENIQMSFNFISIYLLDRYLVDSNNYCVYYCVYTQLLCVLCYY